MFRLGASVAACLGLLAGGSRAAADTRSITGHLVDLAGGRLGGELVATPDGDAGARDTILWRSPRFAEPFEFRLGDIAGILFATPAEQPDHAGPFVHLRGGDSLPATIESLDADNLVVTMPQEDGPQRLRIARREVSAISRTVAGAGGSVGPAGLEGWTQDPPGTWREEAGRILADKPGATVTRDVGGPVRARYAIRLSRRRASEFRIAVAAAARAADDGYVLQAMGGDPASGMMLVRRAGGRAAIEPLPPVPWRDDTLRVVLFVDQEQGRLAAILPDAEGAAGQSVTEVTLRESDAVKPSGRFRLELTGGDIGIDRLEVSAWRGAQPTLRDATGTTVVTKSGPLDGFTVASFDAAGAAFVLTRANETQRVAVGDVEEIRFPDGEDEPVKAPVRVLRTDGGSLSGDVVKVDDTAVWLRRSGIEAAVALPRRTIVAIRPQGVRTQVPEPAGRLGTLIAGADRSRGWLAGGVAGEVRWQPLGSLDAATLTGAVDAEVEYAPPRVERKSGESEVGGVGGMISRDAGGFFTLSTMMEDGAAARDGRIQTGDRIIAIAPTEGGRFVETKDLDNETVMHLLRGRVGDTVQLKVTDAAGGNPREIGFARGPIHVAGREILLQALQTHARLTGADVAAREANSPYPALVVLRSGDVSRCRLDAIDAAALILETPPAGDAPPAPVRVPAELVKAVELIPSAASRELDKTILDRLLTVPRMQRDRPPTHLLRLIDGDYLRGRLVEVDTEMVTFEVLDVVKRLPREQVARLIWLHPERPDETGPAPVGGGTTEDGVVVQGVAADGRRITLVADGVEGDMLRGRSRAFGASVIDLTKMDRVLLGAAVGRDVRELPFAKWRLKPAPEPRAAGAPAGR